MPSATRRSPWRQGTLLPMRPPPSSAPEAPSATWPRSCSTRSAICAARCTALSGEQAVGAVVGDGGGHTVLHLARLEREVGCPGTRTRPVRGRVLRGKVATTSSPQAGAQLECSERVIDLSSRRAPPNQPRGWTDRSSRRPSTSLVSTRVDQAMPFKSGASESGQTVRSRSP